MRLLPRLFAFTVLFSTSALAAPIPPGCEEDAIACKEDCTIEYGGNGRAIRKLARCFEGCTDQRNQCTRKFNAVNGRAPDAPEAAPERRNSKTEAAKLREIEEKDRKRDDDPFGDEDNKPVRERPARDAYDDPPEPPPERKGYRASDAEAEKKPSRGASSTPPRQTASVPARAAEPPPARTPPPPSPAVAPTPEPEPTRSEEPDIEAFAEPPPRAEPVRPAPKPVVAEPATPSRDTSVDDDNAPPPPPVVKKAPPPRPAEAPRPKPPPEPKKDISDWDPNGD